MAQSLLKILEVLVAPIYVIIIVVAKGSYMYCPTKLLTGLPEGPEGPGSPGWPCKEQALLQHSV